MCLVGLAWCCDPQFPLILLANRDEFFERPSAPLARWRDQPAVIAGRDLKVGGTWLGAHSSAQRFAVVTNVRQAGQPRPAEALSRGFLVPGFLNAKLSGAEFAARLSQSGAGEQYEGFNLLLYDGTSLISVSNRSGVSELEPGIHGLSNAALNTAWPKVDRLKQALGAAVQAGHTLEAMEHLLCDDAPVDDEHLPRTGVPLEWERKLAKVFIDGDPAYGTRARTSVRISADGAIQLREWSRHTVQGQWELSAIIR